MASQGESSENRDGPDEPAEPGPQAVTPAEAKGPTPDAGKGGQGQQVRDRRARSDELTLTSADSYRTAGGARDGGAYDSAANRFRSNVEIVEKPRQMIVLLATIAGASYLGFSQNDTDPDGNTRAATMGAAFLFLVHCFLQCRDSLFVRPHPGVWRVVHGIGMIYLFGAAVLLIHPKDEARRLLAIFIPDVESHKLSNFEAAGPLNCKLTASAVLHQLREVWFLAHLIGWWCKMCLFRDWGVCWVLSIGFELLELSMGWLVPQFHECWWDSLIIDLLGANLIGMTLGLYTLRFLETRTFDWNSKERSTKFAKSLRLLSKFSPFRWSKWRWQAFSSFKRTAQVFAMVAVTMLLELNAFMVMNAFEIPKTSNFNYVRISVLFLVALLASSEYYEYCSNPSCDRLGQNAWLILAIMQVEILLWVKFFPQPLMNATSPPEVRIPWVVTLSLFCLWGLLFVAVSEEPAASAGGTASASESCNSLGSLLDCGSLGGLGNGGGGDGGGGGCSGVDGGGGGVGGSGGGGGANGSGDGGGHEKEGADTVSGKNGSGDGASDNTKLPRRDSATAFRSKRSTALLVAKWGLVDAVFILSFLPLLYLVKQWSY